MRRPKKLSGKGSRRLFTATASKTHGKNIRVNTMMRGGYRL